MSGRQETFMVVKDDAETAIRSVLTGRLGTHEAVLAALDALNSLLAQRDEARAALASSRWDVIEAALTIKHGDPEYGDTPTRGIRKREALSALVSLRRELDIAWAGKVASVGQAVAAEAEVARLRMALDEISRTGHLIEACRLARVALAVPSDTGEGKT